MKIFENTLGVRRSLPPRMIANRSILCSKSDRPVTVAMINFITVYRERILLVHLDNPIPGSLRKMLNVILGGVSRYSFMVLSKCVHGAVLTLAIFSEMGQRLESSLHRCL